MGIKYSNLVDYDKLDPFKRKALEIFEETFNNIKRLNIRIAAVGETAAVLDFLDYDFMLAFNVEGLGTKNLISDSIYKELKDKMEIGERIKAREAYRFIGHDALAMSVTDLVAVGADPIVYGDIISSGNSNWFDDDARLEELLVGYMDAANIAGCTIACGETPTLKGIVYPETMDLAGASVGIIKPKNRFMYGQNIRAGDRIYGLPSRGICCNGVTKAREIAEKLPEKYFTKLPNGNLLGDELLNPTPIYIRPVIDMLDKGIDVHYTIPITGHAYKKIARSRFPFTYIIDKLPEPPQIFKSLIEYGSKYGFDVSDRENYQVWNMGVFFAIIAPASEEERIRDVCKGYLIDVYNLGHVQSGEKRVVIKEKGIVYEP